MIRAFLILVFIFCASQRIIAQDFESHKWKNRLVVMLADSPDNASLQKQYLELLKDKKGLKDRKLLLYVITPSGNQCSIDQVKCLSNTNMYDAFKKYKTSFECILIGLDGGKKVHRKSPLSSRQLFDIIDAMPMRAQELRKN